jgi:DNA-binding transcriptional MerR regulator/methylmalonyl-CoA mutase cobalamin-binding subunit
VPRQAIPRQGLLSIGALSSATGISIETIRTWERRYGFPAAERRPSGHRVYPIATVPRLRRIAQALARGHRPAQVLTASEADLESLLAATVPEDSNEPRIPSSQEREDRVTQSPADDISPLLAATREFNADRLRRQFQQEWIRRGPMNFLEQCAAPYLQAVGDAWSDGSLDIRHEHFGSSLLGDFLRNARAPLEERATGPLVVLATPAGELHGLGLQMIALVLALAGCQTLVLGVDTPTSQIVALSREIRIGAVALSCVQLPQRSCASQVRSLRRELSRQIPVLVGGAGAPARASAGVFRFSSLPDLEKWVVTRWGK